MFLTPIFGVLFSWAVVGERLHWRDAVGGVIVLLALYISEGSPGSNRAPDTAAGRVDTAHSL